MPSLQHRALVVSLGTSLFCLALVSKTCGQEVWSGYTYSFTRPANSSIQDEITANAIFARDTTGGLYNAAYEVAYEVDYSPEFTLWATEFNSPGAEIAATNYAELNFTDWRTAYGGANNLATNILESNAVVFLSQEEIYLDLRFTGWGVGFGGGGMFAYERAEPPVTAPSGDYNGNDVVDAADYTVWRDTLGQTVANPGDGADGDLSGVIDPPDYEFWKDHFGEMVGGAGAVAIAVPEPTTLALLFGGLLMLTARRQSRSAR